MTHEALYRSTICNSKKWNPMSINRALAELTLVHPVNKVLGSDKKVYGILCYGHYPTILLLNEEKQGARTRC